MKRVGYHFMFSPVSRYNRTSAAEPKLREKKSSGSSLCQGTVTCMLHILYLKKTKQKQVNVRLTVSFFKLVEANRYA